MEHVILAALIRPLFWLIVLTLAFWGISFLPEKLRKILLFRLW